MKISGSHSNTKNIAATATVVKHFLLMRSSPYNVFNNRLLVFF